MEPLEPYLVSIPSQETASRQERKRVSRCPVCGTLETLRLARGMILCTHCFWAMALQKAS